jgi:hypothetical protein
VKLLFVPFAIVAFVLFLLLLGAIGLVVARPAGRLGAQQAWMPAALLTTSKALPGMRFS